MSGSPGQMALRAIPALGLVAALIAARDHGAALRGLLIALAAYLALLALAELWGAWPAPGSSAYERLLFQPPLQLGPLADLDRLERSLAFALTSGDEYEHRLRPVLLEIARERVRRGRGVDLETQPDLARRLLGEEAWSLLQPRPLERRRRGGAGPGRGELAALLERLEWV